MEVDYGTMEYFIDLNKEMISVVLKIFHQWAHTRNSTKYSFIYTNYIVQSIVICCSQEIVFETFIQLSDDFYFTSFKSFEFSIFNADQGIVDKIERYNLLV